MTKIKYTATARIREVHITTMHHESVEEAKTSMAHLCAESGHDPKITEIAVLPMGRSNVLWSGMASDIMWLH